MNYFQDNLFRELIIDNFAGGGGASTGIELAVGQPVDIAINHDSMAIKMHSANHPHTYHLQNDVFAIDPLDVTGGRSVGLAWFSPDCTHFSKAKGGKPRKKEIRDLAWVVIKWARAVKPRIIMLENVEEFKTWGPLDEDGYPIKELSGETFNEWMNQLRDLGYEVQSKELRACDYGAPTIRKRLFIIARSDGKEIVWPNATHGNSKGLKPFRTAADIIDFNIRGISIFNRIVFGKKELAENTMRRIARGLDKFVIKNPNPYIISYHSETKPGEVRGHSMDEPLATQGQANRFGIVTPLVTKIGQTKFSDDRSSSINDPIKTVVSKNEDLLVSPKFIMVNNTGHNGSKLDDPVPTVTTANHMFAMNPVIVPVGYGEAPGQAPRVQDTKQPLNTVVSHSTKHHVVSFIGKEYSGDQVHASNMKDPLSTITSVDHNRLISVFIAKYYSDNNGQIQGSKADAPLSTITVQERNALAAVSLIEYYGNSKDGVSVSEPLHAVTGKDKHAVFKIKLSSDQDLGYWPQIRSMLNKHTGYNLADDEVIIFDINGSWYIMVDIEMRMLEPKELYAAQGFPSDYDFELKDENGKAQISRSEQVAKCGNSVCPPMATALVKANYEPSYEVPRLNTMNEVHHYSMFGSLRAYKDKGDEL